MVTMMSLRAGRLSLVSRIRPRTWRFHSLAAMAISTTTKPQVDVPGLWNQLVQAVALFGIYTDSKHFVDQPLLQPWSVVSEEWDALKTSGVTVKNIKAFLARNFGEPGSDLKAVLPPGWHEVAPEWLDDVEDAELRALGAAVHGLWKNLCRQVNPTVIVQPDQHTLLPLPHPFVVPGDRFRECYNWDSYWIILGLLACDLTPAAEQLVHNMLDLVDKWGFVPNGARSYYTNRSQPPLLSAMVLAVWHSNRDHQLLADAMPRLVAQHRYWVSGNKAVRVRTGIKGRCDPATQSEGDRQPQVEGGSESQAIEGVFVLSRYHAELYGPRPESFREDVHLAAMAGLDESQTEALYCDIASAAESGWDFSSRWFVGGNTLESTRTTQIIPADLNAWLYRMERDISAIAAQLGDLQLRDEYEAHAARRLQAINTLMWSPSDGCWHDLLIRPSDAAGATGAGPRVPETRKQACTDESQDTRDIHAHEPGLISSALPSGSAVACASASATAVHDVEQRSGVYASNWVPLWCGCAEPGGSQAAAAVAGLQASGLVQDGGVLTSLYASGQQWDAPNAWPPLVHMAVEALAESGVVGAQVTAADLAKRWLYANLKAWNETGHMHEKYNGYEAGGIGGGGEYAPQVGFGWTNGVALAFLRAFCSTAKA